MVPENHQKPRDTGDDPPERGLASEALSEEVLSPCSTPPPSDPIQHFQSAATAAARLPDPIAVDGANDDDDTVETPSYEDRAKAYQNWTLSFLNPLLKLGASKVLVVDDLGRPSREDAADVVHDAVVAAWEEEIQRAEAATQRLREKEAKRKENGKKRWCWHRRRAGGAATAAEDIKAVKPDTAIETNGRSAADATLRAQKPKKPKAIQPSLSRAIVNAFGKWRIFYAVFLIYISSLVAFIPIILLNDLVKYFEASNAGLTHNGWAHPWAEAVGLGVFPLVASLLQTRHSVIMQHCAVFARTGCSTLLFRKALRVSPTGRARTSTGQGTYHYLHIIYLMVGIDPLI